MFAVYKKKVQLNKVFFVEAETSSYLPSWRKTVDYTKSYSAFPNRGGGVLLDLSHEIDYLKWLFKDLNISKIYKGLPKKFIFPRLRIFYFRLAVLFYNIKDKLNI